MTLISLTAKTPNGMRCKRQPSNGGRLRVDSMVDVESSQVGISDFVQRAHQRDEIGRREDVSVDPLIKVAKEEV